LFLRFSVPETVIAGLDPAIRPLAQRMDARIKSGHDGPAASAAQGRQQLEEPQWPR
jgi:hypothetical protein